MEATQLRIGNKLQKSNGEIFTVSRLDESCDVLVKEHRGLLTLGYNLTGISLTEEILLKCGFIKTEEYYAANEENIDVYTKGSFDVAFIDNEYKLWIEIDEDSYYNFAWTKIKYVHQLQNLYFTLTGQELEINL